MARFSKKDFFSSIVTGLITGMLVWRIFDFIPVSRYHNISYAWLVLLMPILWVFGVWLGYFLGRWFDFFNQFGKYVAIGFTNSAIDFGVFYFLVFLTDKALGIRFTIFKSISFIVGVTNSYFWNKYWAFEAGESRGGKQEAGKFLLVNVVATIVNVGIGSFVANGIGPLFNLTDRAWAGLAVVTGSAVALIFSFVGFRFIVFKTQQE